MRSGITSQISGALGHGRLWQSQPNQCYSYESNEVIAVRLKARGADRKHSLSNCQEEVMNLQCTRPCRHTSGSSGRILCCFTKCSYLSKPSLMVYLVSVCLEHSTQKVGQTHQSRLCYEVIFQRTFKSVGAE